MTEFQNAIACLPTSIRAVLEKTASQVQRDTQEIRLRVGAPLTLSTGNRELLVTSSGETTELWRTSLYVCSQEQITDCFQSLCEYSVHTHQQEICHGYISTRTGCRAGLAGTVVVEDGEIVSMRQVTSICLRIARNHEGCASSVLPALMDNNRIRGALLCGEPSSGKTSLLRDIANQLSAGNRGRRCRVAVIDERGELSYGNTLKNCDVLLYSPKGAGIQQAVRCLAPDVVIFDELGTMEETQAVIAGLNAGVAVITSAHGRNLADLQRRPPVAAALHTGAFERVVLLEGRLHPGVAAQVISMEDIPAAPRSAASL